MVTILTLLAVVSLSGVLSAQAPVAGVPSPAWANQRITLRFDSGSPLELLEAVATAGRLTLQIDDEVKAVIPESVVSARFPDARVGDVLTFVLKVMKLSYKSIDDNTIQIIRPAAP